MSARKDPGFYISDARSLICKNGNTSVALPSHSPEADRCSRVFLQTMPTGFFHKHSSGRRIAVTSLPRPPEIPCFFFPQSCRAFSMTAFPSGALPLHSPEADRCSRVFLRTLPSGFFHKHSSASLPSYSPEADRCSRVFLQTMPTGFFHKHSSVNLPSYSPEADRCSRVFLRTILTGFFHKHSSGRRDAGEYKQLSAAEAYPRVQK